MPRHMHTTASSTRAGSAVACGITRIDALPPAAARCSIVYLSGNRLAALGGLEQFGTSLRVLSLGSNLLQSADALAPLQACPHLEVRFAFGAGNAGVRARVATHGWPPAAERRSRHGSMRRRQVLTLEGNPLDQLPNYRARALALLPRLKTLDGRAVAPGEAARAAGAARAEGACLAVMLSNACLVHKLVRTRAIWAGGAPATRRPASRPQAAADSTPCR